MDLEISLHVSASACQAQIFPRSKRQVVPLLPPLNSFHSVYKNALLGPHTFCIASSVCIQSFTDMPNGHTNRWVLNF